MSKIKAKVKIKKPVKWALKHDCCVNCGTIKRKHRGRGLCVKCYARELTVSIKSKARDIRDQADAKNACRPLEWTPERCKKEADDFLKWSDYENNLVMEKFGLYREPPYTRSTMYKIAEKDVNFASAMAIVRERLRTRREEGASRGTYNASVFQFCHGFQDRDNQDKNQSFTSYKDERKKVSDTADINKQKQALDESKQFVEDAKKRLAKKKKLEKA